MTTRHLSSAELVGIAIGRGVASARDHLAECTACGRELQVVQTLLPSASAAVNEVEAAGASAREFVERMQAGAHVSTWRQRGASNASVHIGRALLDASRVAYDREPIHARELALAALDVARLVEHVDDQFEATKDLVSILCRLDATSEAAEMVAEADRLAPCCDDPELAAAIVCQMRAHVLADGRQWDAALAELSRCTEVFARRAPSRFRAVMEMKAFINLRRNEVAQAVRDYEALLRDAATDDERCRYLENIAEAFLTLREPARALRYADKAMAICAASGATVTLLKLMRARGRALLDLAQPDEALRIFLTVSDLLERSGMMETYLRAELDVADAWLAIHGTTGELAARLHDVCALAMALEDAEPEHRCGLAAEAWGYVDRLAQQRTLTRAAVSAVSAYLAELSRGECAPFVPPAVPHPM